MLDYPPLDLATSPWDKPQPKGCIPPEMAMVFDACYIDPTQVKDPFVSPQQPIASEPGEGSFDDPTLGQNYKTFLLLISTDNLQHELKLLFDPLDQTFLG
jgi:hypothetical protein